jgi:hypothetical protein
VRLRSWLRCLNAKALVEYRTNFVSDFGLVDSGFLGRKLLLLLQGTWALHHQKPHTLAGFHCEEKSMGLRK